MANVIDLIHGRKVRFNMAEIVLDVLGNGIVREALLDKFLGGWCALSVVIAHHWGAAHGHVNKRVQHVLRRGLSWI